jgi:hypothetical protein
MKFLKLPEDAAVPMLLIKYVRLVTIPDATVMLLPDVVRSGPPDTHNNSGGVVAEQDPLHWILPVFVMPQELAEDVQADPSFGTQDVQKESEGATAEHVPSQATEPDPVMPHEFETEHDCPAFATQEGGNGQEGATAEQFPLQSNVPVPVPHEFDALQDWPEFAAQDGGGVEQSG